MQTDKEILETLKITRSGYGGVLPNGNIVDRRFHPNAMPFQKNEMMGCPEPLPLEVAISFENAEAKERLTKDADFMEAMRTMIEIAYKTH